jgi:osmoprotectant transport system ATP-binding protein
MSQRNITKASPLPKTKKIIYRGVRKTYKGANAPALDDVSFEVREGELIVIIGTSGSGKTTLIKTLNRLVDIDAGEISLFSRDVRDFKLTELRSHIGYVIQEIGLFPHMTVEKNIEIVPSILKWDKEKKRRRTTELLELVELNPEEFRGRYPRDLSGGQAQRVGLARALAALPEVMILDEPFGALDAITRSNLQDELLRIHRKHKGTYLFVTHDIGEAFKLATRIIVMDAGKIVEFGTPSEIRAAGGFVEKLVEAGT